MFFELNCSYYPRVSYKFLLLKPLLYFFQVFLEVSVFLEELFAGLGFWAFALSSSTLRALDLYFGHGNVSRTLSLLGLVIYLLYMGSEVEACFGFNFNCLLKYLFLDDSSQFFYSIWAFMEALRSFQKYLIRLNFFETLLKKISLRSYVITITKGVIIFKPVLSPKKQCLKKLVIVLATSTLVMGTCKKVVLQCVSSICYSAQF